MSSSGGTGDENKVPNSRKTHRASNSNDNDAEVEQKSTVELNIEDYSQYVKKLMEEGLELRSDQNQPDVGHKPSWFDDKLYRHAQTVYARHLMAINFSHLSGLLLLVRLDSIYRTLSITGESDTVAKLFKRYYNTIKHVKQWYEGDIFDRNSDAYKSMLIVRGMHNKVSSRFNDTPKSDDKADGSGQSQNDSFDKNANETCPLKQDGNDHALAKTGVHISKFDLMITQFAFVGLIVLFPKQMGLIEAFDKKDLVSLLHFWRVIGYYLGVDGKFNLCAYKLKDIEMLCKTFAEDIYKESMARNVISSPPGIMTVNIVRAVKFIPMLTAYGILTHLNELLGRNSDEVDDRKTVYSNLSHTLIKLVMSRLLAYQPLRSFNNGLIRLSLYMVGKTQNCYANHLKSQYGDVLNV